MKFKALRKFAGSEFVQVTRYLYTTLSPWCSDLLTGLQQLSFRDNFTCDTTDVSLATLATLEIPNQLGTAAIDVLFINNSMPFVLLSVTAAKIKIQNYGGSAGVCTVLVIKR